MSLFATAILLLVATQFCFPDRVSIVLSNSTLFNQQIIHLKDTYSYDSSLRNSRGYLRLLRERYSSEPDLFRTSDVETDYYFHVHSDWSQNDSFMM